MVPVQRYQVPSQQSLAFFWITRLLFYRCCGRYRRLFNATQELWRKKGCPDLVVPKSFLSRSFLLARLFVVLAMMRCQTSWRLVSDGRRSPPAATPSAVSAVLEDDRLSMVLEAGVLEDDRLSMVSETDAAAVEASSNRLRVSGAGEAQQPGQRGCRTARSAGPGRHARAERGVQHAPRFEPRRQRADALDAGGAPPLGRRALLLSALRRVLTILISFLLLRVVSLTLHVPIASMSHCMRNC